MPIGKGKEAHADHSANDGDQIQKGQDGRSGQPVHGPKTKYDQAGEREKNKAHKRTQCRAP